MTLTSTQRVTALAVLLVAGLAASPRSAPAEEKADLVLKGAG